jgi:hypothetical protein
MTDTLVAVVSDMHTNSTTGLCPFSWEHENGVHKANDGQRWLWRNWRDYWQRIANLKSDTGLPVVAIFAGDAHDGDHHGTTEIITRNPADQLRLAVDVMGPALEVADRVIIIRGTSAHTGEAGWMEEKLAQDISSAVWYNDQQASWWHLYGEFGGVLWDVQHHPEAGGTRPWTSGNGANVISSIVLDDYVQTGDRIPDVVVRAHRHQLATSGQHRRPFVIQLPPWQLSTGYVKGPIAAAGKINAVGGMYAICRDGHYTWEPVLYHPRRERARRIEWTS